jgi:hypothetical protein
MCTLCKAYTGEWAWKATGDRLQGPRYLSREDHELNIRGRTQRTDTGKYSFVIGITKFWNQLPAEVLARFPWKPHNFRKRVMKCLKRE